MVETLSGGRIAYVHVKGMDSPSFRNVYSELLSDRNRNKEAVIVDTRHNGGGWLHDDLATLLSGKEYQRFVPRGQGTSDRPDHRLRYSSGRLYGYARSVHGKQTTGTGHQSLQQS